MIGFDTGPFFLLESERSEGIELFERVTGAGEEAAVSSITIFELIRHGYRGALPRDWMESAVELTRVSFLVAGTDDLAVLRRGAAITHGMGIHMADALIAASLEEVGCQVFYTTNEKDFRRYEGPMAVRYLAA